MAPLPQLEAQGPAAFVDSINRDPIADFPCSLVLLQSMPSRRAGMVPGISATAGTP